MIAYMPADMYLTNAYKATYLWALYNTVNRPSMSQQQVVWDDKW